MNDLPFAPGPFSPALSIGTGLALLLVSAQVGVWPAARATDSDASTTGSSLTLHARARVRLDSDRDRFQVVEKVVNWDPKKTALIVCDMWDQHWCRGATARVAEMAPRMNAVLKAARARGALIIHAPSDTMKFYADYPQRRRAQQAPKAPAPPQVSQWQSLNHAKEPPLPIDDSDGGCDDVPQCPQGGPWRSQIAALDILPDDVISDQGNEVYNVLQQLDIENVIVMGVHANMCVLGRSFAIRAMVGLGKNVLLMRDMTDTMYNSRSRPYVSHCVGTDLVVTHIEKYWCPTISSVDFLGGEPFRFKQDRRPTVAYIIGENEYRTWETLPAFAQQDLAWRGFNLALVMSSTNLADHEFTNYTRIADADLLVVSARRRAPRQEMLDLIRQHLAAGKPLIGIRTASHAFAARLESPNPAPGAPPLAVWPEFDAEVLGGNYGGHFAAGTEARVAAAPGAEGQPLLTGVALSNCVSTASLYRNAPLQPGAQPLLVATIPGQPAQPLAWTHVFGPKQARIFYTSLGAPSDFANPTFRRLLLNGVLWALDLPIPPASFTVADSGAAP